MIWFLNVLCEWKKLNVRWMNGTVQVKKMDFKIIKNEKLCLKWNEKKINKNEKMENLRIILLKIVVSDCVWPSV